jgi:chemotaxis signal transduction protein
MRRSRVRQVDEMRAAFDASFAAAPSPQVAQHVDLLGVRVADRPFVIRLRDVAGIFVDKSVTALPGAAVGLLGLAGFRGLAVPVYHLGILLGTRAADPPRWMVLANGRESIALAFDAFDGHFRVPRHALAEEGGGDTSRRTQGAVRIGDEARPVVHIGEVVAEIRARASGVKVTQSER